MVTIHDGNLEKTACESPDSQQSQLGKADYDVNVAVEYRHQLQILICDEWTLLQMAMGSKLLHETHEKKNLVYLFWQKTLLSTHKIYKKT